MNDLINNYTLGRGELHFAKYLPGTRTPSGERYFGNTPELNYTAEQETLNHYSSDHGIRRKDASVMLQLDYLATFITDNISPENLALFFLGESFVQTTTAQTALTTTFAEIVPGQSYQLGTSADAPTGMRNVANVTIAGAEAGVDFVVDAARGRVTLLEESEVFVEGEELTVTFDVEESARNRTVSKSTEVEGALRFLAFNAAGDDIDFYMPYVKITPNGDFAIKGDEWQQLPFNIEILKKGALESVYLDGQAYTLPTAPPVTP